VHVKPVPEDPKNIAADQLQDTIREMTAETIRRLESGKTDVDFDGDPVPPIIYLAACRRFGFWTHPLRNSTCRMWAERLHKLSKYSAFDGVFINTVEGKPWRLPFDGSDEFLTIVIHVANWEIRRAARAVLAKASAEDRAAVAAIWRKNWTIDKRDGVLSFKVDAGGIYGRSRIHVDELTGKLRAAGFAGFE
jgi:hypothetical protein